MAGIGAPIGNKYRVAIDDPINRQLAFESYCNHLAAGKVAASWYYEDGEILCCAKTMQSYISKNPLEFPSIKLEVAKNKGYQKWESVVESSAFGSNKDANTASLQMLMRNKFGWDKDTPKGSTTAYTIKLDANGIATGLSTERISEANTSSAE